MVFHQRICCQNPLIRTDRLRCGHCNLRFVHTTSCPDTFLRNIRIGHGSVAHRISRKHNLTMGDYALIYLRLLFCLHYRPSLRREFSGRRIVITGDHGRSIIRCILSDKDCRTCHKMFLSNRLQSNRIIYYTKSVALYHKKDAQKTSTRHIVSIVSISIRKKLPSRSFLIER